MDRDNSNVWNVCHSVIVLFLAEKKTTGNINLDILTIDHFPTEPPVRMFEIILIQCFPAYILVGEVQFHATSFS